MHAANAFNLNRLRSRSLPRWSCSLHGSSPWRSFAWLIRNTHGHGHKFECAHLKFTASGQSKHIDTHTRAQCSHASVGLTQARPNKLNQIWLLGYTLVDHTKWTGWWNSLACNCSLSYWPAWGTNLYQVSVRLKQLSTVVLRHKIVKFVIKFEHNWNTDIVRLTVLEKLKSIHTCTRFLALFVCFVGSKVKSHKF